MALILHGYRYSVYLRIARLALAEKGIAELVQLQKQSRQTHVHAGA